MADRDLSPSRQLASSHFCHNATYLLSRCHLIICCLLPFCLLLCWYTFASCQRPPLLQATYLPLLLPANFFNCCQPLASFPANCLSYTTDSNVRVCQVGTWNLALLVVDKLQLLFLGGELSSQWIILSAVNYLLQRNLAGAWCSVSSPSGSLWNWMHALSRLGS